MPWLRRKSRPSGYRKNGNDDGVDPFGQEQEEKKDLLLVHVPRSGGTSLTQSFGVPSRAVSTTDSFAHRCGMRMFFYTYYLWETDNFPIRTGWNLFWWTAAALQLWIRSNNSVPPVDGNDAGDVDDGGNGVCRRLVRGVLAFNTVFCVLASAGLSVVFVAPNFGRIPFVRRAHLLMVEHAFGRTMDHPGCLTGMTVRGWLLHLTAHKMLSYGYVDPGDFERAHSVAVVRNPYQRMVSLYGYNRYPGCGGWWCCGGTGETFREFVGSWKRTALRKYLSDGIVEEWDTPCHALPQHEYTHFEGVQLVQSIVRHDELEELALPPPPPPPETPPPPPPPPPATTALHTEREAPGRETGGDDGTTTSSSSSEEPPLPPLSDVPAAIRAAFAGLPRANRRPTPLPWYEYYDQDTLETVHEMYAVDFAVFGYPAGIPERPDLIPPPPQSSSGASGDNAPGIAIEPFRRNAAGDPRRSALLRKAAGMPADRSSMEGYRWRRRSKTIGAVGSKKHD